MDYRPEYFFSRSVTFVKYAWQRRKPEAFIYRIAVEGPKTSTTAALIIEYD